MPISVRRSPWWAGYRREEFDGWDESVANARSYEELHPNARKYLERIEELTDNRISIVSVGPRRDQTMRVKPL